MPPEICGSSVGHVVDLAVDIVGLGFVVVGLFVVVVVVVVVVDVVVAETKIDSFFPKMVCCNNIVLGEQLLRLTFSDNFN